MDRLHTARTRDQCADDLPITRRFAREDVVEDAVELIEQQPVRIETQVSNVLLRWVGRLDLLKITWHPTHRLALGSGQLDIA